MEEIYELVRIGKKRQGIPSDRGFALANSINPQVIVDLKSGRSMPNAVNMLKILAAAGKDVHDGIKVIEKQKQAGFADVGLLTGVSISGMTLLAYGAHEAGIGGLLLCILCKIDGHDFFVAANEFEYELTPFGFHHPAHSEAARFIQFAQVSTYGPN